MRRCKQKRPGGFCQCWDLGLRCNRSFESLEVPSDFNFTVESEKCGEDGDAVGFRERADRGDDGVECETVGRLVAQEDSSCDVAVCDAGEPLWGVLIPLARENCLDAEVRCKQRLFGSGDPELALLEAGEVELEYVWGGGGAEGF